MSAFFVGEDHINALLTYARMHKVWMPTFGTRPGSYDYAQSTSHLSKLGQMLAAENNRSLDARYEGRHEDMIGEVLHSFKEDRNVKCFGDAKLLAGHIIKMCDCYDYQACETDDYQASVAFDIVQRIRKAAVDVLLSDMGELTWNYMGDLRKPRQSA